MLGRKMKHMRMPRVAQKSPPLLTSAQVLGQKGHPAPLGNHTADVQTPVRVEIINHPIVALHSGQLLDDMGQMGRKKSALVRVSPRFHTTGPVGTTNAAS